MTEMKIFVLCGGEKWGLGRMENKKYGRMTLKRGHSFFFKLLLIYIYNVYMFAVFGENSTIDSFRLAYTLSSFFMNSNKFIGEVNINLLQDSCLENPIDRGAWWALVHGVTKSWT